ncbi:Rossmann-like domain-containing protein [Planctomycetota bacterium]
MRNANDHSAVARAAELFTDIAESELLLDAEVSVLVKTLTPEEAIGTPMRRDFPIVVGKERVVEASLLGVRGHAFTDSPREYAGSVRNALRLEASVNQNRAILVAILNAALKHLGLAQGTVHCRDDDPERCGAEVAAMLRQRLDDRSTVGLVGLNPAIAEHLVAVFGAERVRITDLNPDTIGQVRFGVEIWNGATRTEDLVDAADAVLLTGTTLVNGTFDRIWGRIQERSKVGLVYGVTAAATSALLGFERVCPYGR